MKLRILGKSAAIIAVLAMGLSLLHQDVAQADKGKFKDKDKDKQGPVKQAPTPALALGLLGLGVGVMRKHKAEQVEAVDE